MTTKHTPGPWTFTLLSEKLRIAQHPSVATVDFDDDPDPRFIAWIGALYQPFGEEDVANARLIAAAPELLEACKAAVDDLVASHAAITSPDDKKAWDDQASYECYRLLQSAIAQATKGDE